MSSAQQNVEFKRDFNMLGADYLMFLGMYVDNSDGTMAYFDDFLYDHGTLIANDGRIFDRGEPDPVFFRPYESRPNGAAQRV